MFTCLQYYSDANDAESWMTEKMYVVSSEDYGRDEQSAMVGLHNIIIRSNHKGSVISTKSNLDHGLGNLWTSRSRL